jgi:hypothetical protein
VRVIPTFVDIGTSSKEAAKSHDDSVGIKRLINWSWFTVTEIYEEELNRFHYYHSL